MVGEIPHHVIRSEPFSVWEKEVTVDANTPWDFDRDGGQNQA